MSTKTVKTIVCDMCGAEIDAKDDAVLRNCVLATGYGSDVVIKERNLAYDPGFQEGITRASLDLCPSCADRAAAIQLDVTGNASGNGWDYAYSWRDGR